MFLYLRKFNQLEAKKYGEGGAMWILLLFLLLSPTTGSAQDKPCPCAPRSDPSSFSERRQNTEEGFDLEWFSDADKYEKEKGRYCYERLVTNHHPTAPLRFDWHVGRLESDNLAPRAGKARTCSYYGEHTTREGPLNYGRGNDKTQTKVYEAQDEPKPQALTTIVQVDGFVFGRNYPVRLSLTSEVAQTIPNRFLYRYKLHLLSGSQNSMVHWRSAETPLLRAALEKMGLGILLNLAPDKPVEVSIESADSPTVQDQSVIILGPQNLLLLRAGAAAYVPAKR